MKKMMTLALGLSLFTGSALFAAPHPGPARNQGRNDKRRQDDHQDRRSGVHDQHQRPRR
jgi:hypothetical protein